MGKIKKGDHFVGAFITSLLHAAKGIPILFDEDRDSKRLQIYTDLGDFNLYVKYTTNFRDAVIRGKSKRTYSIAFTEDEMQKLENGFVQEKYQNAIAAVLGSSQLNDTRIAVIPYEAAMGSLRSCKAGKVRTLHIIRYGKEHIFHCYGAGEKEEDGVTVYINHMRYFESSAK